MNCALKWAVGVSLTVTSLLSVVSSATAQEVIFLEDIDGVTEPRPQVDATLFPYAAEALSDRLLDSYYTNDQNYYDNRSIGRQILWFFGLSHTDNEINQDAKIYSQFVQDMWHEQWSSSATVRTMDLPNPYQSSLLLDPTIPTQEFPPTSVRQPIPAPPTVATPAEVLPTPVPALW